MNFEFEPVPEIEFEEVPEFHFDPVPEIIFEEHEREENTIELH